MDKLLQKIHDIGIIPVIAIDDSEKAVPLAKALISGGLPAAEITFRTSAAADSIRRIRCEIPDMLIGAGTVLTTEQADRAIDAGVDFIVSPGFNPSLVKYVIQKNIPILPGTATPGEMEQAMSMGLHAVKFFPAEQNGGIAKLKAIAGPYKDLMWMPTGGINTQNLNDYLAFYQILACGGTWMVKKDMIENEQWEKITATCTDAVNTMLGLTIMHIGINCVNADDALQNAENFSHLFNITSKDGNSSVFAGNMVEFMKCSGRGHNGHIAIGTNNIDRAMFHLRLNGVQFDESSKKTDGNGDTKFIYMRDEFCGFAVHLIKHA